MISDVYIMYRIKTVVVLLYFSGRAYVLVEFCSLGSIESFLRNNRYNFCDDSHAGDYANGCGVRRGSVTVAQQFNRKDLIQWSVQILQGMQYLEEKKVGRILLH